MYSDTKSLFALIKPLHIPLLLGLINRSVSTAPFSTYADHFVWNISLHQFIWGHIQSVNVRIEKKSATSCFKRFAAFTRIYPQSSSRPHYIVGDWSTIGGWWYISVWHLGWWPREILGRYITVAQVIGLQGTVLSDQSHWKAGRQVGNEKQQSPAFSHTMQCQLLSVT